MVNNILSIINLILVVTALVIAIIALTNHTKDGYQENLTDGPYCDYNYAIPPYTCCKGTDGKMDPREHCSIINDYNSIVCREGAHKATPENCIPGYYCNLDTNQCEIPVDSDGNHDYKLCKGQSSEVGSGCYTTKEYCEAHAPKCQPPPKPITGNYVQIQFKPLWSTEWLSISNNNCWHEQVSNSDKVFVHYDDKYCDKYQCTSLLYRETSQDTLMQGATTDNLVIGCACSTPQGGGASLYLGIDGPGVDAGDVVWKNYWIQWKLTPVNSNSVSAGDTKIYEKIPYYMYFGSFFANVYNIGFKCYGQQKPCYWLYTEQGKNTATPVRFMPASDPHC